MIKLRWLRQNDSLLTKLQICGEQGAWEDVPYVTPKSPMSESVKVELLELGERLVEMLEKHRKDPTAINWQSVLIVLNRHKEVVEE